jgi:hypothetical protein
MPLIKEIYPVGFQALLWRKGLGKNSQMRAVPWKSGASTPRNAHKISMGLQPCWSFFVFTTKFFRGLASHG